ncbi:hypothetical protein ACLB2K_055717 [Fragaria x ananassa]
MLKAKQGLEAHLVVRRERVMEAEKKIAETEQSARLLQSEREKLQLERDDVRQQLFAEKDKVLALENERKEFKGLKLINVKCWNELNPQDQLEEVDEEPSKEEDEDEDEESGEEEEGGA